MITDKQLQEIRDELDECQRPLFLFHDDADGLCSFLLLYRYVRDGKGVVVKSTPRIDEKFLRKVMEYMPDKIFIVDIANVDQEFVDKAKTPIVWIDHHEPQRVRGVKYFNPRVKDKRDNVPASYICYRVVEQDLWIAMVGSAGDWYVPDFKDDFIERYPKLLKKGVKDPEKVLFGEKIGKIARIFSFVLKGTTTDAMKCVKILTRIKNPEEILYGTSPAGKYILKRFEKIDKQYQELFKKAVEAKSDDKLFVFTYTADNMSFSSDISNELLYRYPDKVILIAREKSGEMRTSLRCGSKIVLPPILEKALVGIDGYGGGHEHACGVCVKVEDWDRFLGNLRIELEK